MVADVVGRQAEAGIDVISDGEFGKSISWSQYALERLSGFERRPMPPGANPVTPGADRTRFTEFYAELDVREADGHRHRMVACVGPIEYTGQATLQRDIANFKAALKGRNSTEAFCRLSAPASVLPDRKDEYYKSEDDRSRRSPRRCAPNTRAIVDAGFILQIDDALLAVTVRPHGAARRPSQDYRSWARRCASKRSITRSKASREDRCAITSAGAAGTGRTSATCRSRTSSTWC